MRALAAFIVAGPYQAVLVVVLSTVVSFLAPPWTSLLGYVAAAALALYSLHAGARRSVLVLVVAAVILGLLAEMTLQQGLPVAITSLLLWLPVWLAALVLRATVSLALAMVLLTGLAMAAVLLVFALFGDPGPWWLERLQGVMKVVTAQQPVTLDAASLDSFIEQLAPLMTGLLAAGLNFAALTCLMLGRWWQALLVNPGGARQEFYALHLNRTLSIFGITLIGLAAIAPAGAGVLALQGALIVLVPFLFVGLAVVHATLANLQAARGWLLLIYILMALLPHAALLVILTGALDPWLDLRRRTAKH